MERWRGKTALVTGASAGIGYAITLALVEAGVNVVGCARNPAPLEELRHQLVRINSGKLIPIKSDLTKEAEILTLFKEIESQFSHVDILVNNAGTAVLGDLVSGDTEEWRQMLELNILATTVCTREALKLMEKDGVEDAHIININSISGHNVSASNNGLFFYSGTKHMITALTKGLYTELAEKKSKIRVTSVSPGLVSTRLIDEMRKDVAHGQNFKRTGLEGKDIADAVLYVLGTPLTVVITELTIVPNANANA